MMDNNLPYYREKLVAIKKQYKRVGGDPECDIQFLIAELLLELLVEL